MIKKNPDIIENAELKWTETIEVKEKDIKKGRLRIGGTALKETLSRNGKKYTVENCKENDSKEVTVFVEHDYDKGPVGKTNLGFDEQEKKLLHDTWIKNTHQHPDIVENVADGLYKVSIGGNGKLIREKDGFSVKSLDIREMSIVGLEGIDGAGIDYAIAESFKAHDKKPKQIKAIQEVDKMEKEKVLEKENKELKEKLVAVEKAQKEDLVESILKINEKLDKNELREKSDSELKLIKEYEEKLKEQDDKKGEAEGEKKEGEAEGEKKEDKEEGNGEVEPEGDSEEDKTEKDKEFDKNIVFEEKAGTITMNEKARLNFNKEIRESIYR